MTGISARATSQQSQTIWLPFAAVVAGALAMGISPIFVRLADVGPFTSAFWRVALALPVLWLWAQAEQRRSLDAGPNKAPEETERDAGERDARIAIFVAGILFAGDLIFWHLAIVHTSVANATFFAVLAPVWVVLGSGLFLNEAISRRIVGGLGLCLLGGTALIASTLSFRPDNLNGDIFGIITSFFFGGYILAVRRARRYFGSGQTLYLSSLVTAVLLLVAAFIMEDQAFPQTWGGLVALLALALFSHAGGQGLLAYALGHLPAAFSSLVIFLEAVAAAFSGWIILGETLTFAQIVGALAILAGIALARPR